MAAKLSTVLLNGVSYELRDSEAISLIENIQNSIAKGMRFLGEVDRAITVAGTTNVLTDLSTRNVYIKTSDSTATCYYTGTKPTATTLVVGTVTYTITYSPLTTGDFVIQHEQDTTQPSEEYVFSSTDTKWHLLGSAQSVSGTYKPKGTVTTTLNKSAKTLTHTVTQGTVSATGTVVPKGTITQGTNSNDSFVKSYPGTTSKLDITTVHDTPTLSTASIKTAKTKKYTMNTDKMVTTSIRGVAGTVVIKNPTVASSPTLQASVQGETLVLTSGTLSYTDTTVATASTTNTTVATGTLSSTGSGSAVGTSIIASDDVTAVTGFTDGDTNVTTIGYALSAGAEVSVAKGTLSAQGTGGSVMTGLGTPTKANAITSVGNSTFTGTETAIEVNGTTSGVSIANHSIQTADTATSTFNGTQETITLG